MKIVEKWESGFALPVFALPGRFQMEVSRKKPDD